MFDGGEDVLAQPSGPAITSESGPLARQRAVAERAQLVRQNPPLVRWRPVVGIEPAVGSEPVHERDQPSCHDLGLAAGHVRVLLSQQ